MLCSSATTEVCFGVSASLLAGSNALVSVEDIIAELNLEGQTHVSVCSHTIECTKDPSGCQTLRALLYPSYYSWVAAALLSALI